MEAVHSAQGKHNSGDVNGARDDLLRARSRFTAAQDLAPEATKGKISAAVSALDKLNGGISGIQDIADQLPPADYFIPQLPAPLTEALKMIITQSIQVLNPAEWLTEPDRVVQKWMDAHGLTSPTDVQKFLEEHIANEKGEPAGSSKKR